MTVIASSRMGQTSDPFKELEDRLILRDYSGGGRYVVQTPDGDKYAVYIKKNRAYFDCSSKKVWVKHSVGIFLRPIHAVAKTVATPLKMAADIYNVGTKQISIKEFGKRSFEHLTDFIRVPFYSTLILITNILASTLSPVLYVFSKKAATSLLMQAREIAGVLELVMYRVDSIFDKNLKLREFVPFLYPCFTSIVPLKKYNLEEIQHGLSHFAARNIEVRRKGKPPCDSIACESPPEQGVYISSALKGLPENTLAAAINGASG